MGADSKQVTLSQYVYNFTLDFRKKEVAGVKLLQFTLHCGIIIMIQFGTVYMASLGLSLQEIAILNAVLPMISFLLMPASGALVDKLGKPKLSTAIVLFLTASAHLSLLWVPVREASESPSTGARFDSTFISYSIIQGLAGFFLPLMIMCTDQVTMAVSVRHKSEFSFQKFYGMISRSVAPLFVGVVMDWMSQGKARADFSVAFYQFAASQIAVIFILGFLDIPDKKPHQKTQGASAASLFRNPAVFVFLVIMFIGGIYKSFSDSFCMLYFKELGASNSFFGLRGSVAGVSGIVFTFLAGFIIQKVGCATIFAMAMILHGVRLLVFSAFQNPYQILPIEALEGPYLVMFMVTMTTYCGQIAPASLVGSLQGMVWGLFLGLGRASGSLIGGVLISYMGNIAAFRVLGLVGISVGVVYYVLYNSWLKHVEPNNDQRKENNNKSK